MHRGAMASGGLSEGHNFTVGAGISRPEGPEAAAPGDDGEGEGFIQAARSGARCQSSLRVTSSWHNNSPVLAGVQSVLARLSSEPWQNTLSRKMLII